MHSKRLLPALVISLIVSGAGTAAGEEVLTGSFRMSGTAAELFDAAMLSSISGVVAPDQQVKWQVFVPESYSASRPAGVFVFIDPDGWGGMPDQYRQLFTSRNLIWIGASADERKPDTVRKLVHALMAERVIDKNYAVNLSRIYIGSAGVDAVAAVQVMLIANQFTGAVYINGSTYWEGGKPKSFDFLVRKPHVFIIGAGDAGFKVVRRDVENYRNDGIEKVELVSQPGKIRKWPEVEQMDEALAILDAR